jgi:DNA-binding transcriptional MocR family regulator
MPTRSRWLPKLEGRSGPVYRAIANAIDEDVQKGLLRAGTRLPPHRDLADHLGVTVTTVTRAYTEAARRGLTSGHVGRGTFIRGEPEEASGSVIDLSINILMPDREVAALESRVFQRRALPWTELLGYTHPPGHPRHREAMATWLDHLGLPVGADRIVLTAGAQHAMHAAFAALTKPGDTVLVEELTYSGVRSLAGQMHLKLRGVAMDAEGLRPDALDAACRTSRARVLYCMPRLQNPTSAIMSERRRRQIATLADRHRLTVVEDDVYGFLSPERTPLATLLPERTLFLTSVSKSLFPGIRLGCVAAPRAFIDPLSAAVHATMIMTSPIGGDLLHGWVEDGTATRIVDWKRHEMTARQTIARRLLGPIRMQTHASSSHIWLHLPPRWSSESFAAELRARGVLINAAREFAVADAHPSAVRVCLGTPRTRAGLEQALSRLVELFHERIPADRIVV